MKEKNTKLFVLPSEYAIKIWAMFAGMVALLTFPVIIYFYEYYLENIEITTQSGKLSVIAAFAFVAFLASMLCTLILLNITTKVKKRKLEDMGHIVIRDDDSPFM